MYSVYVHVHVCLFGSHEYHNLITLAYIDAILPLSHLHVVQSVG